MRMDSLNSDSEYDPNALPFSAELRNARRMFKPTKRYEAVIADIDSANASDPRTTEVDGEARPYEVVYSERMSARMEAMYPDASEVLRIAAHGQHIRRFDVPRTDYEVGRKGYNEWRRACREHHAELLEEIMSRHGYSSDEISKVQTFVRKEQLKKDKDSQALENVVDVVFVEHYLGDFVAKYKDYDEDKLVDIIGKTLRKMSPKGHQTVLALDLPDAHRKVIEAAVEREAETLEKLAKVAID